MVDVGANVTKISAHVAARTRAGSRAPGLAPLARRSALKSVNFKYNTNHLTPGGTLGVKFNFIRLSTTGRARAAACAIAQFDGSGDGVAQAAARPPAGRGPPA